MEYYKNYEKRYQAATDAGIDIWGHSERDEILASTLKKWVADNSLIGKTVIEFACGEGSCGIILSQLGVIYHGADIAPTALEKAKERLRDYPDATFELLDMVKETPKGKYDAALDVMGMHMLITDDQRLGYLKNAHDCLKENAPMLFFRENYSENAPQDEIKSLDQFKVITGIDFDTPQKRIMNGKEVYLPTLPSRARSEKGYCAELQKAGFKVELFSPSAENNSISCGADIYVRKI